ncbi:MAG: HEAT repeat domain-containing protein [Planctomycetaceae bacterium]
MPLQFPTVNIVLKGRVCQNGGMFTIATLPLRRFFLPALCVAVGVAILFTGQSAIAQEEASPMAIIDEIAATEQTQGEWRRLLRTTTPQSETATLLLPALMQLVEDQSTPPELRQQVVLFIGRMGRRGLPAVPLFVRLLDDTTPVPGGDPPRQWGLKALAYLGPFGRDAIPVIVPIATDLDVPHRQRLAAIEALSQVGTTSPFALTTLMQLSQPLAKDVADRSPLSAQEQLEIRTAAVESIAFFRGSGSSAIPKLLISAHSESEGLRRATATTLGMLGSDIVTSTLVDMLLFDHSPAVRDAAAVSLAELGPSSIPTLQQLLNDRESEVRWRAADALGRISPPAAIAKADLTRLLTDPAPEVRLAAAEGLWKLHRPSKELLSTLSDLLGETDRTLRMRSYRLLLKIAAGGQRAEVVALFESLRQSPLNTQRQAATLGLRLLTPSQP